MRITSPAGLLPVLYCISCVLQAAGYSGENWHTYHGDASASHYSLLDQINTANVSSLVPAWSYDTGDAGDGSQMQCNPLIIDGVLYATSPRLKVFALDAASGKRLWQFDPYSGVHHGQGINRGVTYWQKGDDRRILFTAGPYLYALNADDGSLVPSFGINGRADLRQGLDRDPLTLQVDATSPGVIYQDLIIMGSRVGETPEASPGHIRAYNVINGGLAWVFHTIPYPGEHGHDTWPEDAWRTAGGANSWAGMSVDHERGMVFVPTGSPSFDFYGGDRHGDNLFANSVLALDAATGRRHWHFQTVHHDLWDRDLPAQPNLVTVTRAGKPVPALAQISKSGFVFLFDRSTGKPLFEIEERPVPASAVGDEMASPTQPEPVAPPPFTRQVFNRDNVTDISTRSRDYVLKKLREMNTGAAFLPPTDARETVIFPGFDGGAEWGGAAWDPGSGMLYVNATELPWTYRLTRVDIQSGNTKEILYQKHCAGCHGMDRRGNGRDFPSILGVGQRLSYPQIAGIIRAGKGRMPGFPQLNFENIMALLDYVNLPPDHAEPGTATAAATYLHTGYFPFYDEDGYPAIRPPWGTLTAIDLNRGVINWQVPLGEYPGLAARGIRNTGTENYGGPVVTRGGLVFIAATMDEKFRAFDKNTGALLWETGLPAAGFATPATYAVEGRQYVVIAAGGGKSGRDPGGTYMAFTLPRD